MKYPGAVGADLDTCPELTQFVRLFINFDVKAAADERKGGRVPANARTDDGDFFQVRRHDKGGCR